MYLGGNHWWVARRSLPPDMKLRSVFFCFVVCVVSCLFPTACYCRILRFLSCLIYWNAKKCSVFLASRSPVHSCTFFFLPIFHVTHHVTGLDQWKHSWIGWWTRAEVLSFTRFCSISWGIFCLLVAFISLAIMGWCSLFTKRLVM